MTHTGHEKQKEAVEKSPQNETEAHISQSKPNALSTGKNKQT